MEEERTREELVNEINELALSESTDLVYSSEEESGSADMLIGAAIGTGVTALIAGGAWLWRRHKRKKAEKEKKNNEEENPADSVVEENSELEDVNPEKKDK